VGYSLHLVQAGEKPENAKPLTGLGVGILEIVCDYNKGVYRAVYTVKIGEFIYVLHCFQKKSKRGIKTPKQELDLIKQRLVSVKAGIT
jgi:phage-related protein